MGSRVGLWGVLIYGTALAEPAADSVSVSPTVDGPSGGADGRGQAPTVDGTAPPSGGADGRGQAPTVDGTAPPSGGADGRGQAPTVEQRLRSLEDRDALERFRASPPLRIEHHRGVAPYAIYDRDAPLDREGFYQLIGRDDLADAYRHRVRLGTWASLGGLCGLAGALALWHGLPRSTSVPLASVLSIASGLSTMGGLYLLAHPEPISRDEAAALTADYNERAAHEQLARWRISAYMMPGGAGAGVEGGF